MLSSDLESGNLIYFWDGIIFFRRVFCFKIRVLLPPPQKAATAISSVSGKGFLFEFPGSLQCA